MRWYFISYVGWKGFFRKQTYGCFVSDNHGANLDELHETIKKAVGLKEVIVTALTPISWDQYKELKGEEYENYRSV